MEKTLLPLIEDDKFEAVRSKIFNQTLSDTAEGSFTAPLSFDEELAITQKVVAGSQSWQQFLGEYMQHYALSNPSTDLLFANQENPVCRPLLEDSIKKYGYNHTQAQMFVQKNTQTEEKDEALITLFCQKAIIFYPDIHTALDYIDPKYAKLYKESSEQTLGFTAVKKTTAKI